MNCFIYFNCITEGKYDYKLLPDDLNFIDGHNSKLLTASLLIIFFCSIKFTLQLIACYLK